MNLTIATVNKELKRLGRKERLVRGKGYYYFVDGDAPSWYTSSIPTYSISNWTLEDVITYFWTLAID